jgi:hypothetical protein
MAIDHLSLATTPIILLKGDTELSQGTGFFYTQKFGEKQVLFLVTNYHVLTGSSPTEKKEPIGDNFIFQLHQTDTEPGNVKTIRFPLFTKNGRPIWIQPKENQNADLAIIPLASALFQDCKIACIAEDWSKLNLRVRPTSAITLIGYPYGFYDKKNSLPVWKTGNVASEPSIDFEGDPYFLIDISAFPGMSGSPVFAISYGSYETEDGTITIGGVRKFLGIYASMQMLKTEKYLEEISQANKAGITLVESLQLGHVWKANLIIQTVNSIIIEQYEEEILGDIE